MSYTTDSLSTITEHVISATDKHLVAILIHNENNGNNIAFSPYGAASILIALGEGLQGEAVYEIQKAVHIPHDVSIIRVGLRDIHRHLKSYFIPEEGFLAGITLNNENVNFNQEYENILRFYGFDIKSFNQALYTNHFTTTVIPSPNADISKSTVMMNSSPMEPEKLITVSHNDEGLKDEANEPLSSHISDYDRPQKVNTFLPQTSTTMSDINIPIASTTVLSSNSIMKTNTDNMLDFTSLDDVPLSTNSISTVTTGDYTVATTIDETTNNNSTSSTPDTFTNYKSTKSDNTTVVFGDSIFETTSAVDELENESLPVVITHSPDTSIHNHLANVNPSIFTTTIIVPTIDSSLFTTAESVTTETFLSSTSTAITTDNMATIIHDTQITTAGRVSTEPSETNEHTIDDIITTTNIPVNSISTYITNDTLNSDKLGTTTISSSETTQNYDFTNTIMSTDTDTAISPTTERNVDPATENIVEETIAVIRVENDKIVDDTILSERVNQNTQSVGNEIFSTAPPHIEDNTNDTKLNFLDHSDGSYDTDIESDSTITTEYQPQNNIEDLTFTLEYTSIRINNENNIPTDSSYLENTNRSVSDVSKNKISPEHESNTKIFESSISSTKRVIRSVADYIVAPFYDDHYSFIPRPYEPEESMHFLIDGKFKEPNINFTIYDTVLPFMHLKFLDTLALRFPLDSAEYYLLLLLPLRENKIDDLVCHLRLNANLRFILNHLEYTHVKATIPSFNLKGHVLLTNTLQMLGIHKIFEPRHADFAPMTKQKDIYVTNIEQAVTVAIRNYVDPNTINNNRKLYQTEPVEFNVNHPFLYFVIDAELQVILVAGKIVNPLNSRIK